MATCESRKPRAHDLTGSILLLAPVRRPFPSCLHAILCREASSSASSASRVLLLYSSGSRCIAGSLPRVLPRVRASFAALQNTLRSLCNTSYVWSAPNFGKVRAVCNEREFL